MASENSRFRSSRSPFLIVEALVFDGEEWRGHNDVLLDGGLISEVGTCGSIAGPPGTEVVRANGAALVPGLIDIHGMDRSAASISGRDAINLLSQGITTVVTGNCGVGVPEGSVPDLAINVAELAGHNGAPRGEGARNNGVEAWLREKLEAGSRGVSLGLMYEPGRSASSRELEAVANLVADCDGVLAVHIRDEGPGLIHSLEEVIAFRRSAQTLVMHLKACGEKNWPQIDRARDLLHKAGVGWTYYPYTDTNTRLSACVPFPFQGARALERMLDRPEVRNELEEHGLQTLARGGWDGVLVTHGPTSAIGRSVAQIARERDCPPATALVLLLSEDPNVRARFREVAQLDATRTTARDSVAIPGSDAYVFDSSNMSPEHPRSFGAMARSLCWARDGGYLEQFLRSASSRPADLYGLDRGRIEAGRPADLALIDLERIQDRATYDEPGIPASGILRVWVGGCVAFEEGLPSTELAGVVL